jgi:prophage antirepressor-like protein
MDNQMIPHIAENCNSQLTVFQYTDKQVRTIAKDGEPWFVAKDVLEILDLNRSSVAILDDDERGVHPVDTLGGDQVMSIVSEAGLYSLILGSRKPEAKEFKRWVTHEVIPSIRKHGAYMTPEVIERTLTDPDYLIRLATTIKTEREARLVAEHKVKELEPKGAFFDAVAGSKDCVDIGTVAKVLHFNRGRNTLFKILRDNRILMYDNKPYQEFCDRGYFRVIESTFTKPNGDICVNFKTVVYQRGIEFVRRFLVKQGYMKESA